MDWGGNFPVVAPAAGRHWRGTAERDRSPLSFPCGLLAGRESVRAVVIIVIAIAFLLFLGRSHDIGDRIQLIL